MVIAGCVGGFITGSVAGAALGFIYSLILSLAGQDDFGMLLAAALLGLLYGFGIGSIAGTIGGALFGSIFGFIRNLWVGPTLAAVLGLLTAYELYGTPAFNLARYGWTIFPLAAVFAGAGGLTLSIMLMRVHQKK